MPTDERTYGFSKDDATELVNKIGSSESSSGETKHRGSAQIQIFFTPPDGIPERSGTTLGQASCTRVRLSGFTLSTLSGQTNAVGNLSTEAVGGSKYIQAVKINGTWVANWEQCDE